MKLTEVYDDFKYVVKPLQYLIHTSIRDEALGDFWELHHARMSQSNKLFGNLISIIQFCSLIVYSFQLAVEDMRLALIPLFSNFCSSHPAVLVGLVVQIMIVVLSLHGSHRDSDTVSCLVGPAILPLLLKSKSTETKGTKEGSTDPSDPL